MTGHAAPLYELVRYRTELETLADAGEIPPEQIRDTLEALEGDIRDKAIAVAQFIRNLETTGAAVREAAMEMLHRAERIEKRADAIRQYLLFQCQVAGIQKIDCPWFTLTVRKNPPAVIIDDPSKLPEAFMVQPPAPPPRPDKVAISVALKAGTDVPGARLFQFERLDIKA